MNTTPYAYRILIFGPQAVMVEQRELEITHHSPTLQAIELQALISQQYPVLKDSVKASRLAANHEFVSPQESVSAEDELALIGMISGG